MGRFRRAARGENGAAALEFALVLLVLVPLAFGIIDYGLFFTDSLAAKDGARYAARQGSVDAHVPASTCSGYTPTATGPEQDRMERLACLALEQTSAIGGTAYAHVVAPQGLATGEDLQVCVAVTETGVTGLTPMPNNRTVRSRIVTRLEKDEAPPPPPSDRSDAFASSSGAAAPPADLWNDWCPVS
jgi:Flp pilus assembly protein TadG